MSQESAFERFNTLTQETEAENEIGLDTALLIAAATAKGISPSLWLCENVDPGVRPFSDFSSRLIGLGLAVGIQEDRDTKKELDHATSKASLRTIYRLCKAGKDSNGVLLVDVGLFLRLCNLKILEYIGLAQSQPQTEEAPFSTQELPILPEEQPSEQPRELPEPTQPADQVPGASAPSSEELLVLRPPDLEASSPIQAFTEGVIGHDKELSRDEERTQEPTSSEMGSPPAERLVVPPHKISSTLPPRPAARSTERQTFSSTRGLLHQDSGRLLPLDGSDPAFSVLREVELLLRRTVRQTDLYHIVQVHLGFLSDKHCFQPPRGKVSPLFYFYIWIIVSRWCFRVLENGLAGLTSQLHSLPHGFV